MPTRSPATRAVIYCRISRDTDLKKEGVERQEKDGRALAKEMGWSVVEVFTDNDVSAYSGKPRPAYRAMLATLREGRADAVIAWHSDRLHRRIVDLEEFVKVIEDHGVEVATVQNKGINLTSPDGRMNARILASVAQREIEHNRSRVLAAKASAAEKGKYRGGPRPYGFEPDGVTVRESEAAIIRELTAAVIAGRSLASLKKEMDERIDAGDKAARPSGLRSRTTGEPIGQGTWRYGAIRDMLLRPRNAGILAQGLPSGKGRKAYEIIREKADWEPIVSRADWDTVVSILTDPSRRMSTSTATKWLGSRIYRCGVLVDDGNGGQKPCGAVLQATSRKARILYRCTARAHLSISQKETDALVMDTLVGLVNDPRVIAQMTADDPRIPEARKAVSEASRRLAQVERDYDDDLIDARRYAAKRDKIRIEMDAADDHLARLLRRSMSSPIFGAVDPGDELRIAGIDVQRAVLSTVLRVEVLPLAAVGKPNGSSWTSDRVRLTLAE